MLQQRMLQIVNVTESAVSIKPVDELIASTKGGVELSLKFVPVINYVSCCVFNNRWTDTILIVGNETLFCKR